MDTSQEQAIINRKRMAVRLERARARRQLREAQKQLIDWKTGGASCRSLVDALCDIEATRYEIGEADHKLDELDDMLREVRDAEGC